MKIFNKGVFKNNSTVKFKNLQEASLLPLWSVLYPAFDDDSGKEIKLEIKTIPQRNHYVLGKISNFLK